MNEILKAILISVAGTTIAAVIIYLLITNGLHSRKNRANEEIVSFVLDPSRLFSEDGLWETYISMRSYVTEKYRLKNYQVISWDKLRILYTRTNRKR